MLKKDNHPSSGTNRLTAFILLFFFVFTIYSNTFKASWHLDDYANIVHNPRLHFNDFSPESLIQSFFASIDSGLYRGDKLYRPVAGFTFALNWYFGKGSVTGFHIVNIFIHVLTAFALFATVFNLFQSPKLKKRYQGREYLIALLVSVFWAINPIQTQAVTYIVQRAAILATFFCISGIYFYIKGRRASLSLKQVLFFSGCFFCFVFAIGSKENAITFPVALLLVEICFFQNFENIKKKLYIAGVGITIIGLIFGLSVFISDPLASILHGYKDRSFTLLQRLMTEPRVLIFYLSQIFYPLPSRLSIDHDFMISTSLFTPWTTLPAIFIIFFFIWAGVMGIKERPLAAFAILFFFLTHVVESTVIPLEIIFEHRNYLPSSFLFLPVFSGFIVFLERGGVKKRSLFHVLIALVGLLMIWLGCSTYIRNEAWLTEKSLWEDAMAKAPKRSRPVHNLAVGYYQKICNYDKALELYEKALTLTDSNQRRWRANVYNNMAGIYERKQEYENAETFFKKAIDLSPDYEIAMYNLNLLLIKKGDWDDALTCVDLLLERRNHYEKYLNLKGFILIKLKRFGEALEYLQKALRNAPNYKNAIINVGEALSLAGQYKKAEMFFLRVNHLFLDDIFIHVLLIQNSVRALDEAGADQHAERMFTLYSIQNVRNALSRLYSDENLLLSVSQDMVTPVVMRKLNDYFNSKKPL